MALHLTTMTLQLTMSNNDNGHGSANISKLWCILIIVTYFGIAFEIF